MQILGLLLILINVFAVAGPVTGVVVTYYSNPVEMIMPPEVEEIVTTAVDTDEAIEMPQYVGSTYDIELRTVTATFSFKNPFRFDLSINSVSADVECAAHGDFLGRAAISNPVEAKAGLTVMITVVFTWTQTAESHFLTAHSNQDSIDIKLVNLNLDVSGIVVETPESISLTAPLPR